MMSSINQDHICSSCFQKLKKVYDPFGTKRGVKVYRCNSCSLLQSIGFDTYISRPPGSMSCNADRSSIKYTKTLVLKDQLDWMKKIKLNPFKFKSYLDIGSNRGSFLREVIINNNFDFKYHAVETDPDLVLDYINIDRVKTDIERIENIKLKQNLYDFIYFIHTLEHVVDINNLLKKIKKSMTDDGLLYISVPNIEFGAYESFSEVFIDPHTFHFDYNSLKNVLDSAGLEIVSINNYGEPEIKVVCKKNKESKTKLRSGLFNISKYDNSINFERNQIKEQVRKINKIKLRRIFWGAGRILDGLVLLGGLNFKKNDLLVDKSIGDHFELLFNKEINKPDKLESLQNKDSFVIIICSKEYYDEIKIIAENLDFKNIIHYEKP